jgi:hypothetical protein
MEVITAAIQSSAEKKDRFVTKSVYMKWLSLLILLGSIYFSYKPQTITMYLHGVIPSFTNFSNAFVLLSQL